MLLKPSKQVAHDIRSPLTALEIALKDTSGLSEGQKQLLEQASHRIKAIAEDLLSKSRQSKPEVKYVMPEASFVVEVKPQSSFDLNDSIIRIVREKNAVVSGFEIATSGVEGELSVIGEKNAFERSLSNLIQNSIEALEGREGPSLLVAVRKYSSQIQVIVADNGKGIPAEVLTRIGEEGFSFDKANGNGLGVSGAKKKLQEWGGDLTITSQPERGTMVSMTLPRVPMRPKAEGPDYSRTSTGGSSAKDPSIG